MHSSAVIQDLQGYFSRVAPKPVSPQLVLVPGIFLPKFRSWHQSLFHENFCTRLQLAILSTCPCPLSISTKSPALGYINYFPPIGGDLQPLCCLLQVTEKDLKKNRPHNSPMLWSTIHATNLHCVPDHPDFFCLTAHPPRPQPLTWIQRLFE